MTRSAPVTSSMEQRRSRGVRYIRFVRGYHLRRSNASATLDQSRNGPDDRESSKTPPIPFVFGVRVECDTTGVVDHHYKPAPRNLCTMDIPAQLENSAFGPRRIQLVPDELSLFRPLCCVRLLHYHPTLVFIVRASVRCVTDCHLDLRWQALSSPTACLRGHLNAECLSGAALPRQKPGKCFLRLKP